MRNRVRLGLLTEPCFVLRSGDRNNLEWLTVLVLTRTTICGGQEAATTQERPFSETNRCHDWTHGSDRSPPVLDVTRLITALVAKGESETVEFKKSTSSLREAIEAICAFANHRD